eukprot:scaffold894_cov130-Isochrysis_galbana.AAC.8
MTRGGMACRGLRVALAGEGGWPHQPSACSFSLFPPHTTTDGCTASRAVCSTTSLRTNARKAVSRG